MTRTLDLHLAKALKLAQDWKETHPNADACDCATAVTMNAQVVVGRVGAEFDDLGRTRWPEFLTAVESAI